jgi:hypothetical protein
MVKKIIFDRHAVRRMKERQVTEEEVQETIATPDSIEPSIKGRTNSYTFSNGRFLRVTHKEEMTNILIITVTIRKKPFKE